MFRNFFFLFGMRACKVRDTGLKLYNFTTAAGNNYSIWKIKKMDQHIMVLIHDDDDEIAAITDDDGKYLYLHPRTLNGAEQLLKKSERGYI